MKRQERNLKRSDYLLIAEKQCGIPSDISLDLVNYILKKQALENPFLKLLICGKLKSSSEKANTYEILYIGNIVHFLCEFSPMGCWGSQKDYKMWIK
jgi:hypothetical protein